jgi:hypothetical protein
MLLLCIHNSGMPEYSVFYGNERTLQCHEID